MPDFTSFGKVIAGIGALLVLVGLVIMLLGKISGLGHLPGDIFYSKGNFSFYFPLATCLIVSVVLTIILNLILRR